MSVVIAYFDNKSLAQFMSSSRTALGHKQRTQCAAGTIVVMVNLDTKHVVGACMLRNWEWSSSPCRQHNPLDIDVYGPDYAAYNAYEIGIDNLHFLKSPITLDKVRILVGGAQDFKGQTNMWKGFHRNYAAPFVTGDDKSSIERYKIWAESLV
jgi:hypothetical protein